MAIELKPSPIAKFLTCVSSFTAWAVPQKEENAKADVDIKDTGSSCGAESHAQEDEYHILFRVQAQTICEGEGFFSEPAA